MKRLLRLYSNRKSRRELLSTSEASWATTKSVGMCDFLTQYRHGEAKRADVSLGDCGVELAEDDMLCSCIETVGEQTTDVKRLWIKTKTSKNIGETPRRASRGHC